MAMDIWLTQLHSSTNEAPESAPARIARLRDVALQTISDVTPDGTDTLVQDGNDGFTIDLPGGTATIGTSEAVFPIEALDLLTMSLVYRIAREGQMIIVTDGGDKPIILTHEWQMQEVVNEWLEEPSTPPVCKSAKQLIEMLIDWYLAHTEFQKQIASAYQPPVMDEPIPGATLRRPASTLYIERRPTETPVQHQTLVFKFRQRELRAGTVERPNCGILMADFWEITTPEGRCFLAYAYGGDKPAWLKHLQTFATEGNRLTGVIEHESVFVQDDGVRFALSDCVCRKVSSAN